MAQGVKNLPVIQETWVRSLDWQDSLEKRMATHSSILAWRIPWTEKPGGVQSTGSPRVRNYWVTDTFFFHFIFINLKLLFIMFIVPRFSQFSLVQFSSVHSLSCVRLFATPWIAACQASLSITNSRSSLRLTSIESVMPSSHLILGCPLLLLPPIPPRLQDFKYLCFHSVSES